MVFHHEPSGVRIIDPSYTIANFIIDISNNPPYPENTGAITNFGIVWELSGNYYDNSGNENILDISFNDGSHNFGPWGDIIEKEDDTMVSLWPWSKIVY